ncbi:DinB family protein [Streptomyces sp. NPDC050504]|uniref:DinB family protein n=1 Tax=Streptomyces sp. NPDC050504 TaxID=3365618 RepID=UPI0037984B14
MTTPERTEVPLSGDEHHMLASFLDFQRETLAWKCSELDAGQLRHASVPPSQLTLLGLVRHLTENERGWFHDVMAGEEAPPLYASDEDPDGEFHPTDTDTWEDAYAAWQASITRSKELMAGRPLDELSVGRDRTSNEPYSLRWIYTHMIEEYARHNGHADLIREVIDGSTGE